MCVRKGNSIMITKIGEYDDYFADCYSVGKVGVVVQIDDSNEFQKYLLKFEDGTMAWIHKGTEFILVSDLI